MREIRTQPQQNIPGNTWRIIPVRKWLGSPPFISHKRQVLDLALNQSCQTLVSPIFRSSLVPSVADCFRKSIGENLQPWDWMFFSREGTCCVKELFPFPSREKVRSIFEKRFKKESRMDHFLQVLQFSPPFF